MSDELKGFQIQPPNQADFDSVVEFMKECDQAEYGEPDTDAEDVRDQWSEVDLSKDAWMSRNTMGEINGYALLSPQGENGRFLDLYTNVTHPRQGVEETLLDCGIDRLQSLIKAGNSIDPCSLTIFLNGKNEENRRVVESRGFQVKKYHYRMQLDFQGPAESSVWPDEYTVRTFQPGDENDLYNLTISAFDWTSTVKPSLDTWYQQVLRSGRIEPELLTLVFSSGGLVGASISYDDVTRGWIKQLAVERSSQGRGLGTLLLRNAFVTFYNRGLPTVSLGVVATNEKAYRLYEKNGMMRTREFVQYQKDIYKVL